MNLLDLLNIIITTTDAEHTRQTDVVLGPSETLSGTDRFVR